MSLLAFRDVKNGDIPDQKGKVVLDLNQPPMTKMAGPSGDELVGKRDSREAAKAGASAKVGTVHVGGGGSDPMDVNLNSSGTGHAAANVKREAVAAEEPRSKKQRAADNGPTTSGSPSVDVGIKPDEEKSGCLNRIKAEDSRSNKNSDRDTPPVDEPRRANRGASKKGSGNRQLNNKNFLRAVLPNMIRLSRAEIMHDLRVRYPLLPW